MCSVDVGVDVDVGVHYVQKTSFHNWVDRLHQRKISLGGYTLDFRVARPLPYSVLECRSEHRTYTMNIITRAYRAGCESPVEQLLFDLPCMVDAFESPGPQYQAGGYFIIDGEPKAFVYTSKKCPGVYLLRNASEPHIEAIYPHKFKVVVKSRVVKTVRIPVFSVVVGARQYSLSSLYQAMLNDGFDLWSHLRGVNKDLLYPGLPCDPEDPTDLQKVVDATEYPVVAQLLRMAYEAEFGDRPPTDRRDLRWVLLETIEDVFDTLWDLWVTQLTKEFQKVKSRDQAIRIALERSSPLRRFSSTLRSGRLLGRQGITKQLRERNLFATAADVTSVHLDWGEYNVSAYTLHPSSQYRLCPVCTPEEHAGQHLHLTYATKISLQTDELQIDLMEGSDSPVYDDEASGMSPVNVNRTSPVYVNGTFQGMGIWEEVSAQIPDEASLSWYDGTIQVWNCAGRLLVLYEYRGQQRWMDAWEEERYREQGWKVVHKNSLLSYVACHIPFINCNSGPRSCVACKHLQQAVKGWYTQHPIIANCVEELHHVYDKDIPATGLNVLVAVLPYEGYNVGDGIVVNKDSVERGMFLMTREKRVSYKLCADENHEWGDRGHQCDHLDEWGLPQVRSKIPEGGAVFAYHKTGSTKPIYIKLGARESATVQEIHRSGRFVDIHLCRVSYLSLGDKLASRHGQKGVVTHLARGVDLPVCLSPPYEGCIPDIVIHPLSLGSRKTVGQVLEMLYSVRTAMGKRSTVLQEGSMHGCHGVRPFSEIPRDDWSIPTVSVLHPFTGERVDNVMFGPVFYQRLDHHAEEKTKVFHGKYDPVSGQPIDGREGGGCINRMEVDALMALGLYNTLQETVKLSDLMEVWVCPPCRYLRKGAGMCPQQHPLQRREYPKALLNLRHVLHALGIETEINK
jgi:hypothetical protein